MSAENLEAFYAQLESLGEQEIRVRLARQAYGDAGHKRQLAEEWVQRKERERTAASNADMASAASRSADAAERAAKAADAQARTAKHALTTAIIATIIAAIALIVSIFGLIHITG